jgi:hypothetical protein
MPYVAAIYIYMCVCLLKDVEVFKNYMFQMSRFKEITKEEENTKLGGNPRAFCFKSTPC